MKRIIICEECKKEKEHYAKGKCSPCYMRAWSKEPEVMRRMKGKEYRKELNIRQRRYRRKRYREDLDYREKQLESTKRWIKNNPERHRQLVNKKDREGGLKKPITTVDKYTFIKDKEAFVVSGVCLDKRMEELLQKANVKSKHKELGMERVHADKRLKELKKNKRG